MEANNNNAETNLFDELLKETETKSASSTVIPKFDFSPEAEIIPIQAADKKESSQKTENGDKKVSTEDAELSGETASMLLDTVTNLGFTLFLKVQTRNKFTPEERDIISDTNILDKKEDDLDDSERELKERWKRIMTAQHNKFKKLESSEKDCERRAKIFKKYFKVTNKEISPGWLLAAALFEDIAGKAEAVFLED